MTNRKCIQVQEQLASSMSPQREDQKSYIQASDKKSECTKHIINF